MIDTAVALMGRFASQKRPKTVLLLLFFVVGAGIWLRALAPGIPISDPDTWGYLNPGLSKISGDGFQQTHGRGIAYPLFLFGILAATKSFFAIPFIQHFVGILSGLIWWAVWREWQKWLPKNLSGHFWVQCVGIVFLAAYLLNANTIFYEEAIRPEAVFPILALAQTYFCMVYARARWIGGPNWLLALAGSLAMLFALICLSAKPSWGFAAIIPFALVVAGIFGKKEWQQLAPRIFTLVLGFVLVLFWLKILPPALGWIPDERSKGFLPATLFTVHAPTISKVLHARVESGKSTPQEIGFLEKWDKRISESSQLEVTSYHILDHDPDYLFYHSDAIARLPDADSSEKARKYMFSAYFDSLLQFPFEISAKILRQLVYAHSDLTRSLYRRDSNLLKKFQGSIKSMDFYRLPKIDPTIAASYKKVREQTVNFLETSSGKLVFGPSVNKFLTLGLGPVFLGLWMLGWPFLAAHLFFYNKKASGNLVDATLVFGILWASAVGTTFTVAVVHSFDIDRYLHLLSVQHSLILAVATVLTLQFACNKLYKWKMQ
jgi:hypothetical protein